MCRLYVNMCGLYDKRFTGLASALETVSGRKCYLLTELIHWRYEDVELFSNLYSASAYSCNEIRDSIEYPITLDSPGIATGDYFNCC